VLSADTTQISGPGPTVARRDELFEETLSPTLNVIENSFDFMTQPPNVLLPSSPEKTLPAQKTVSSSRTQSQQAQPTPRETRAPVSSSQGSPIQLEIDFTSQTQTAQTQMQSRSQTEAKDEALRIACIPRNTLNMDDLIQRIPPEAFRGLFCPDDDELATIMERKHPVIRTYLKQRAALRDRKALSQSESGTSGSKRPLLERDNSAERIKWTCQSGSSSQPTINSLLKSQQKRRHRWSGEEVERLIQGYRRFGSNWQQILNAYPLVFDGRTNVDLKDKARNLAKNGLLSM